MHNRTHRAAGLAAVLAFVLAILPAASAAQSSNIVGSPVCEGEGITYNPGNGEDIAVPAGYSVSVFARDLNFPTGIAFMGDATNFQVFVIEAGTGLPGRCNTNEGIPSVDKFAKNNPFTPDLLILDKDGHVVSGPLAKPTSDGGGFQPDGPAIGLAFENGNAGGRLFASDSNQGIRGAPGRGNNTSRILQVDPNTGAVQVLIPSLPTGDHPTENIIVKDKWIYWAQGSATNSGVTGHDNGAGGNQHDIACQDVVLSQNVWDSGDGHMTSGYSNHNVARPGATVKAFEDAANGMHACTGAILRARTDAANMAASVEPFSWGYRNPYGLRFAPSDHPLLGGLFVTVNGEDERGARPTNGAPDRLELAAQNADGSPDWHGWPDHFGDLDSTQSAFNPVGGPADDLTKTLPNGQPDFSQVIAKNRPVRHVLAYGPQQAVAALALEPADVAAVSPDFAPDSWVTGVVHKGAALLAREGDFGFSPSNGSPEEGHDVQLVNFSRANGALRLNLLRFAFNCRQAEQRRNADGSAWCAGDSDQAFEAPAGNPVRGINRPTNTMFGPDGALYVVDFGAVRDFGVSSGGEAKFLQGADAPLVQIPHTGVIWRIARTTTGP